MFTGILKYRSRGHRGYLPAGHSADEVLTQLLRARSLREYRFVRECEIGPFIVDHVCREQALVIDLSRSKIESESRARFLGSLGYRVLSVSRRDLFHRPDRVLTKIRRLLQS
jgi:very-short-patch-repair endonuclease